MSRKKQRISDEFEEALNDIQRRMDEELGLKLSKTEATKIAAAKVKDMKFVEVQKKKRRSKILFG